MIHSRSRPAALALALLLWHAPADAQTAPSLGLADSFAVLGGTAVTNTGTSTVTGDVGVSPGISITGFPPGVLSGTLQAGTASALAAQSAVTTTFNALTTQACTRDLTGQDLGGLTLTPGVYCFSSSAQLTGTLRLDAQANAAAGFIFKSGSTVTTASGSSVALVNGGSPCNVFWQVGSSATLGTSSSFIGNILAQASITLTTAANLTGRALARSGAVTLDTNTVTAASCAGAPPPDPGPGPGPGPGPVPDPGPPPVPTLPQVFSVLLGVGLAGLGYARLRARGRSR